MLKFKQDLPHATEFQAFPTLVLFMTNRCAHYQPAAALTCSDVSSLVVKRARLIAWLARGHPDRLRCVRKLPLACPEPSQPGVGQPVDAHSVLLDLRGRLSIRGVSWIPAATDGGQ